MKESSPYEANYDRTGLVCLGRVVTSDPVGRRLRVKTIGMPNRGMDDLDLTNVRILHGFWHPEGDEEVSIPRVGTYGVVLFVGSEPFWIGASPLDAADGSLQRTNMVTLNSGDRVLKTIGGNRFILRSGGTIEMQSTQQCRTFWIPNQNLITTVCQNWELQTTGGYIQWHFDKKTEDTNLQFKVWNSLTPDNVVMMDIGAVPDANDEKIDDQDGSLNIKADAAANLVFDFRQGGLDDNLNLTPRTMRMTVSNDGSFYFDVGPSKFTMKVDAKTGDVQFETKGQVKARVVKDVTLEVDGSVNATVKKDVTMEVDGSVTATVKKDVTATVEGKASVSAKGGASVSTDGDASVSAKGNVTAKAGGDATVSATGNATFSGTGGTTVGAGASPTNVLGTTVALAGGGAPVARLGDMAIGIGNGGFPVMSNISQGSPKVTSG